MINPIEEQQKELQKDKDFLKKFSQFIELCEEYNIYRQDSFITIFTGEAIHDCIPFLYDFGGNKLSIKNSGHFLTPPKGEGFEFGYSSWGKLGEGYLTKMTYLIYPEYSLHFSQVKELAQSLLDSREKENLPCIVITQSIDLIQQLALLSSTERIRLIRVFEIKKRLVFSQYTQEQLKPLAILNLEVR